MFNPTYGYTQIIEGLGAPRNGKLALAGYRKSAERGDEDAEYRVGRCYENGIGGPADLDEAAAWYARAAARGQAEARKRLAVLGKTR